MIRFDQNSTFWAPVITCLPFKMKVGAEFTPIFLAALSSSITFSRSFFPASNLLTKSPLIPALWDMSTNTAFLPMSLPSTKYALNNADTTAF